MPITIGGLARHNVANALAAAGGARGLGATIEQVRDGLIDFAPTPSARPGGSTCSASGPRCDRRLRPQRGRDRRRAGRGAGDRRRAAGRAAPITAIIGTAGDRPDDTLRGIGRIAAERAQRVAIKQTLKYLRGRTAESVVGELMVGVVAGGFSATDVPTTTPRRSRSRRSSTAPRAPGERRPVRRGTGHRADVPRGSRRRLGAAGRLGARPVDVASELTELVPRMQAGRGARSRVGVRALPVGRLELPRIVNAVPPRDVPAAAIASR